MIPITLFEKLSGLSINLYGASMGKANKSLLASSGPHEQDDRHTHIRDRSLFECQGPPKK